MSPVTAKELVMNVILHDDILVDKLGFRPKEELLGLKSKPVYPTTNDDSLYFQECFSSLSEFAAKRSS